MRRYLLLLPVLLLLTGFASAKELKVRGFVTAVNSPTSFEINDYKINRDPALKLEVEKIKAAPATPAFAPEDIRVGTELEVSGDYDKSTSQLKASSIKVFLFDTVVMDRVGFLDRLPALEKNPSGTWSGVLFVDGERVSVAESTTIALTQNPVERQFATASKTGAQSSSAPLLSLDQINLGTLVHYQGAAQPDGSLLATTVEFGPSEIDVDEAKLLTKYVPKEKSPDYAAFKSGQLKLPNKKFKVVPDREAQDYLGALGASLIPEQQKQLPDGSTLRIPFRFYLVSDPFPDVNGYPGGAIVVNSGVFSALNNEAQLAFMLSSEMASVADAALWRDLEYHKVLIKKLKTANIIVQLGLIPLGLPGIPGQIGMNLGAEAAIRSALLDPYGRSLMNQGDRVGLEWMLQSGYDLREAPESWNAISLKLASVHSQYTEYEYEPLDFFKLIHEARRSFLTAQLKTNYSAVDYSNLKKDSDDFHRIAQKLQQPQKKKSSAKAKPPANGGTS